MLKSCKVFSCLGYPRLRVIKPYTLMYAARRDYSMVVSNPSLATTGFSKPETDNYSDKPVLGGNSWDLPFLKFEFSRFKTLPYEKQRLWLAAHYILKKPQAVTEMPSSNSETAAEVENNSEMIFKIVCSDKICIDAKLFMRESEIVLLNYKLDIDVIPVKSNSEIMKKVELLCVERALIQDDYVNDDNDDLLQHKLNDLNSKFRQQNRIYALDLMTVAVELHIKCLLDLMIEEFDDMFTKMTTDDEVYKILFINLRGEYTRGKFELMKHELLICTWAFDSFDADYKPGLRAKQNIKWDPELLKVSFYEYKSLPYEQRRQWLIAHFLLRQPHVADSIQSYCSLTEEQKRERELRLKYLNLSCPTRSKEVNQLLPCF